MTCPPIPSAHRLRFGYSLNEKRGRQIFNCLTTDRHVPQPEEPAMPIVQLVAILAAALFAGAALYINLVEHPARMELGTALALREFAPSYRRATVMQASLAIIGFVGGVVAWAFSREIGWLIGGLLLGSVVPFTLLGILPTNKRLLDPELDGASVEAKELLDRWTRLHAVRTVLSIAALITFLLLVL